MIFNKIFTLIFAYLSVASLYAMEQQKTIQQQSLLEEIQNLKKIPVTTQRQQCVLDFSNSNSILFSTAKIGSYLLTEKMGDGIDLTDITYIIFEGVGAGARKNPEGFGKLAPFFQDPNAVHNAFGQVFNAISVVKNDLSVLADPVTCVAFVTNTVNKDLPILLDSMKAPQEVQTDVKILATVFTPMFSQLLNTTYTGLVVAANKTSAILNYVEDEIEKDVANCGCFSLCKKGK